MLNIFLISRCFLPPTKQLHQRDVSVNFNVAPHVVHAGGFSFIELSIVLVVLGLITGGVLTGQSLIAASELRATIAQLQDFESAKSQFKDRYFYIPGDMPNAYDFWGRGGNCGGSAFNSGGCNGNGDSSIEGHEAKRAFKHLFLSELIPLDIQESYYGYAAPWEMGFNMPTAKTGGGYIFTGSTAGEMILQLVGGRSAGFVGSALTAEQAWTIDKKIDDEFPNSGKITSARGTDGDGDCLLSDNYTIDQTGIACYLTFEM